MKSKLAVVTTAVISTIFAASVALAADKPMPSGEMPDHPHTPNTPAPKAKPDQSKIPTMPSGEMPDHPHTPNKPAPKAKPDQSKLPTMPQGEMPDHPHR